MRWQPFTPDLEQYLLDHYGDRTLRQIAADLERSPHEISYRCRRLRLAGKLGLRDRYYLPRWTPEDEDYLLESWGLERDVVVAKHLRRSVNACRERAYALGVGRKSNFWTANQVALLFGVDVHCVVGQWIASGCLKARRSHIKGGKGLIWRVDDADIEAFIRRYPWHYDRKRMERGSWHRNLAEQVWGKNPYLTSAEVAAELGYSRDWVQRLIRAGRLQAEHTWDAGSGGGYRVARSELERFRSWRATWVPRSGTLAPSRDRRRKRAVEQAEAAG